MGIARQFQIANDTCKIVPVWDLSFLFLGLPRIPQFAVFRNSHENHIGLYISAKIWLDNRNSSAVRGCIVREKVLYYIAIFRVWLNYIITEYILGCRFSNCICTRWVSILGKAVTHERDGFNALSARANGPDLLQRWYLASSMIVCVYARCVCSVVSYARDARGRSVEWFFFSKNNL